MQRPMILTFVLLIFSIPFSSCGQDDENSSENENTCYRCNYENNLPEQCEDNLFYEICIIGFRENTTLAVMEIKEFCGQDVNVTEQTGFIEDVLEQQLASGGDCQEF